MGNCNIVTRIYDSGKSVLVYKRCHNILESLFKTSSLAKEVKYYYWYPCRLNHRRKIETEEKAKVVVAAAWGMHPFLQIILVLNRWRGNELDQFCPSNRNNDDLCLFFFLYPSSSMDLIRKGKVFLQGGKIFSNRLLTFLYKKVLLSVSLWPCNVTGPVRPWNFAHMARVKVFAHRTAGLFLLLFIINSRGGHAFFLFLTHCSKLFALFEKTFAVWAIELFLDLPHFCWFYQPVFSLPNF